jgi:hypothetical protein
LIIPVHLLDPTPNCMTTNIEIIIAQFRDLCTGNFDFFYPRSSTGWLSGSGGAGETLSHLCTISGKMRLRGAAELLSAGAGASWPASSGAKHNRRDAR